MSFLLTVSETNTYLTLLRVSGSYVKRNFSLSFLSLPWKMLLPLPEIRGPIGEFLHRKWEHLCPNMVACWHLARSWKWGKSDIFEHGVCVPMRTSRREKRCFWTPTLWKQGKRPLTPGGVSKRRQVGAPAVHKQASLFSVTKMPWHIFSGGPGSLMHIHLLPPTLPATVNSSPVHVHTHTHIQYIHNNKGC